MYLKEEWYKKIIITAAEVLIKFGLAGIQLLSLFDLKSSAYDYRSDITVCY